MFTPNSLLMMRGYIPPLSKVPERFLNSSKGFVRKLGSINLTRTRVAIYLIICHSHLLPKEPIYLGFWRTGLEARAEEINEKPGQPQLILTALTIARALMVAKTMSKMIPALSPQTHPKRHWHRGLQSKMNPGQATTHRTRKNQPSVWVYELYVLGIRHELNNNPSLPPFTERTRSNHTKKNNRWSRACTKRFA